MGVTGAGLEPAREDLALVRACVSGDAAAWTRFDARYRRLIVRVAVEALARAGAPDPDDLAQDVASELLAELLADGARALGRYEGRASLSTWLGVLARRKAGRLLDRARRGPTALPEGHEPVGRGPGPDQSAEQAERRRIVQDELQRLAPRDRLALQLFYEGGRSYREVAQVLDLPANRIGTLLARARARLARALGLEV